MNVTISPKRSFRAAPDNRGTIGLSIGRSPQAGSEEAIIQRAAAMVRQTMAQNPWFAAEAITNVRREADMGLSCLRGQGNAHSR